MDELVKLWEVPQAKEIYMIAGWHQWADAGSISSGLPLYLIHKTNARKIGEIADGNFYLFQLPGAHHFLRPEIKLKNGYRKSLRKPQNEIYYSGNEERGLVIFLGEEPHMNADRYAGALLDAVQALHVKRVAAVGGVYGAMPFDKDREVSCTYSKKRMKKELSRYAVRFSNYEGGVTIGTYLAASAEERNVEFLVFYAFVPAYDLTELSEVVQAISIEHDFKAWYDLMRRLNHMFGLDIDLSELQAQSRELKHSMEEKVDEIDRQMPELNIHDYLRDIADDFIEKPFIPLSDVWGKALGNIIEGNNEAPNPES